MSIVAIAGSTFRLRVELESQAASGTFKSSPTLAAGDVKILALPASPSGTEAFANSTNAPIALSGPTAEVVIAATETTAAGDGGELVVVWADAAGDEWYSLSVHIQVKAADVATGTVPSASDNATATAAAILVTPANKLATDANGNASANVTLWAGDAVGDAPVSAVGNGAISFPVTVNDEDSNPIDGVEVWITTDSGGTNVVAGTLSTDALGVATFMLDAGDYYVWRQQSGYNFTNPVAITVS